MDPDLTLPMMGQTVSVNTVLIFFYIPCYWYVLLIRCFIHFGIYKFAQSNCGRNGYYSQIVLTAYYNSVWFWCYSTNSNVHCYDVRYTSQAIVIVNKIEWNCTVNPADSTVMPVFFLFARQSIKYTKLCYLITCISKFMNDWFAMC